MFKVTGINRTPSVRGIKRETKTKGDFRARGIRVVGRRAGDKRICKRRRRLKETIEIQIAPLVSPGGFGNLFILAKLDIKIMPVRFPLHQVQNSFLIREEVRN